MPSMIERTTSYRAGSACPFPRLIQSGFGTGGSTQTIDPTPASTSDSVTSRYASASRSANAASNGVSPSPSSQRWSITSQGVTISTTTSGASSAAWAGTRSRIHSAHRDGTASQELSVQRSPVTTKPQPRSTSDSTCAMSG
jgi:hypothetical protein